MKNLIIIGAGGMGRTIYDMACENAGYNKDFVIKGFIDDNLKALDGFENYPPVVGTIADYQVLENDVFVCSIGGESRRPCMESIIARGGEFLTMIHPSSRIGTNVHIGKGTIIGHDVKMGKWNRIDSNVFVVGGVEIGEGCMIHTRAMLNHEVVVGHGAHVGACSMVINKVEPGTTVFGIPARRIK